ncbi:hypothetical protein AX16_010186 [Volvariella volvacea WC 439]|nr:hypothetical protein AX16_010186 [Volvariella volvacea WC 439]
MTTTTAATAPVVDLTTPPRITKRKLDDAFRILDDAVSTPEPVDRPSPPKRTHTTRSIYSTLAKYGIISKETKPPALVETSNLSDKTPKLNAILSRTATRTKKALKLFKSPPPPPVLPPTAEYRPSSIPAFLSRLATFKLATYSNKPPAIDAVAAAKCGWVNDGKDRLVCGLCDVSWVLASREGMNKDAAAALVEKQRIGLVESHKNGCPWRTRQCDDSIYRIPLQSPSATVRDLKANALVLEPMVEAVEIKHPLSGTQLKALRMIIESYELPTPDEALPDPDATSIDIHKQPSDTAILATLFGWSITPPSESTRKPSISRASSVAPPSISRASTPGPGIGGQSISAFTFRIPSQKVPSREPALLYCSLCQRRVGLWAFTAPSKNVPQHAHGSQDTTLPASTSPPSGAPVTSDTAPVPVVEPPTDGQATSISAPPTLTQTAPSESAFVTPPPPMPPSESVSVSVANLRSSSTRRRPALAQRHFDLLIEHRPHCPYVVKSTIVPSLPVPPTPQTAQSTGPSSAQSSQGLFGGLNYRRSGSLSANVNIATGGGQRNGNEPIEGWRAILTVALRYGLGKRKGSIAIPIRGLSLDNALAGAGNDVGSNAVVGITNDGTNGTEERGEIVDEPMEIDNIDAMVDRVKSKGGKDLLRYMLSINVCISEAGWNRDGYFAGIHVILFGDFHQFPPVKSPFGALYNPEHRNTLACIGSDIYQTFETVVILKQQRQVVDNEWNALLSRARIGECSAEDLRTLDAMVVNDATTKNPQWDTEPWNKAILVTSRHGVREGWNAQAVRRHMKLTGNPVFICPAEDICERNGQPISRRHQNLLRRTKSMGNRVLQHTIELSVGMQAIVTLNISTEAEMANGTRGTIADIILDPREPNHKQDDIVNLQFPPAMLLFKPDTCLSNVTFEGIPDGLIPIFPHKQRVTLVGRNKERTRIERRQYPITGGYAFTDYKAQGQTIPYAIIDLGKVPSGRLTGFNAYVALSRGRGREYIKLLRPFEHKLFTHHPCQHLYKEDQRLSSLDYKTLAKWVRQHYKDPNSQR